MKLLRTSLFSFLLMFARKIKERKKMEYSFVIRKTNLICKIKKNKKKRKEKKISYDFKRDSHIEGVPLTFDLLVGYSPELS